MRLSRGALAIFSLPIVLAALVELAWRAYLPALLTQRVGLSLALVGLLMLCARVIDCLVDPIIGRLSDTWTTRWGRRVPWLVAGVPLVTAGALALYLAPSGAAVVAIFVAAFVLHLGTSLVAIPHGGWAFELGADRHERTRIMGAKVWFASAGMVFALGVMALASRFFALAPADLAMILGVVIAGFAPVAVCLVVRRFGALRPGPDAALRTYGPSVLALACDGEILRISALYMFVGIADSAAMSSFVFLSEGVLGLHGWSAALLLLQPAMIVIVLPILTAASARFGRRRVLIATFLWELLTMPLFLFIPAGSLPWIILAQVLRGLVGGSEYTFLRAMVSDVAVRQGTATQSSAGSLYGFTSVVLKLAMGLGSALALWIIGSAGYSPNIPASLAGALVIRFVYVGPTVLAAVVGLVLLRSSQDT